MRYKSLDETGILMASCGHGVIHCAVNMYEGETYRHTLYAHQKLYEKHCKFLFNDVVYHYWPWLKALGDNLKEFKPLFTEMYPFLYRLHGQAHAWYCQVRTTLDNRWCANFLTLPSYYYNVYCAGIIFWTLERRSSWDSRRGNRAGFCLVFALLQRNTHHEFLT